MKNFLANNEELTKQQIKNIESNWIIMYNGIKGHQSINAVNKYGLIHLVRQIDGYHGYLPTKYLSEFLIKNEIQFPNFLYSKERTRINRKLKKLEIKDSIQIEHLNGGVKNLVDKIVDLIINNEYTLEDIKRYHLENTLCCYKLKNDEKYINENYKLNEIDLYQLQ